MSPSGSAEPVPTERRSVGRPRHHSAEVERAMIFDAAYRVLRESGGQDLTIGDILTTAGVATRAFYRHFQSKDELLGAMYRNDAVVASRRMTERLARTASPVDAVTTWVRGIFGFLEHPERAERVTVFGAAVNRIESAATERAYANALLITPLREAIEAGNRDGSFTSPDPGLDAELLAAAVFHAVGLDSARPASPYSRDEVVAFCLRTVGFNPSGR